MTTDDLTPAQAETIRFMEIVTGVQVVDGPPPPGSPLARLEAIVADYERGLITEAEARMLTRELMSP